MTFQDFFIVSAGNVQVRIIAYKDGKETAMGGEHVFIDELVKADRRILKREIISIEYAGAKYIGNREYITILDITVR